MIIGTDDELVVRGQFARRYAHAIGGEFGIVLVDTLFRFGALIPFGKIAPADHLHRAAEIEIGEIHHNDDLLSQLRHRDGGRLQNALVEIFEIALFLRFFALRHDDLRQFDERFQKREQNQRGQKIEQRMKVRDLTFDAPAAHENNALDDVFLERQHQNEENGAAQYVE